jgi:hypothetical protein
MTTLNKISRSHTSDKLAEYLTLPGAILQNSAQFFEEVREGVELPPKIVSLLLSSSLFLLIYGAVLGSGHPLQAVSAAIKLPLVFLGGLLACTPALYIFDILLGSKRTLSQTLAVLLAAVSVIAILLFSFMPIALVLRLAVDGFQFFKILNVGFLAIAMVVGLFYLEQGLRRTAGLSHNSLLRELVYAFWVILLMFMIAQLAWSLRPFFYYPGSSFALIVGDGGNLFRDVGQAVGEFFGFSVTR